jgi:hypothetical protein
MKLTTNALREIKNHKDCHRALEDRWDKSFYTIETWLRINHPMLCHNDSLSLICAHLRKSVESIVVQEEHDFKPVI